LVNLEEQHDFVDFQHIISMCSDFKPEVKLMTSWFHVFAYNKRKKKNKKKKKTGTFSHE
jgi:hypothetical protein